MSSFRLRLAVLAHALSTIEFGFVLCSCGYELEFCKSSGC